LSADQIAPPAFRLPHINRGTHVTALLTSLLERAIGDLSSDMPLPECSHDARKKLKRARATLRVVRDIAPGFYATENARYRDVGRMIAPLRESGAAFEAIDAVEADYADQLNANPFASVRAGLSEDVDAEQAAGPVAMQLDTAIANTHLALAALWQLEWPDNGEDEAAALARAARRLIRSTRKALNAARRKPGAETLHELRKALKYLWLGGKLMRDVWSPNLRPAGKTLRGMIDLLGAIHDIDELLARLAEAEPGTPEAREALCALLHARRARLETELAGIWDALELPKPSAVEAGVRDAARSAAEETQAAE